MELYAFLTDVIDLRSFSSLWFWIVLAGQWVMVSHWPMGVPFDLVLRARRQGGAAETDLEAVARVAISRRLGLSGQAAVWQVGGLAFGLTVLALLGFVYGVELAQALFCLLAPMVLVGHLSRRAADRIAREGVSGELLVHRLIMLRLAVQGVGMLAILITTMWGMFVNLHASPL